MKRRKISLIGTIALFVIGLSVLLYPSFSDWWNTRRANSLITEYEQVISDMSDDETARIREAATAYNRTLIGSVLPDAFAELQLPPDATYDSMLDPSGSGYMGTVEVPAIDQNLPIYHYTTSEVLEKGAGHLAGSSLPVGGESTHCVITAHRGLPTAKLFTDLDRLTEGDVFYLHVLEETLAYEVDQIKVVEPTQTEDLSIIEGEDLCTLVTCTPYAVNTHRLLVRGHRIPYIEEEYREYNKTSAAPSRLSVLIRILCVIIGIAIALVIIWIISRRYRKKDAAAAAGPKGAENKAIETLSEEAEGTEKTEDIDP